MDAKTASVLGQLTEHFQFENWNGKFRYIGKEFCIVVDSGYVQFIRRNASGTYIVADSVKIRAGYVDLYIADKFIGQISFEDLIA